MLVTIARGRAGRRMLRNRNTTETKPQHSYDTIPHMIETQPDRRWRVCSFTLDPDTERIVAILALAHGDNKSAAVREAIHYLYDSPTQSAEPSTPTGRLGVTPATTIPAAWGGAGGFRS